MVTHSSTSRPVQCLCMAERTGCPVLTDLWSYVLILVKLPLQKFNLQGRAMGHALMFSSFALPSAMSFEVETYQHDRRSLRSC
jgi:hypothetical protein